MVIPGEALGGVETFVLESEPVGLEKGCYLAATCRRLFRSGASYVLFPALCPTCASLRV